MINNKKLIEDLRDVILGLDKFSSDMTHSELKIDHKEIQTSLSLLIDNYQSLIESEIENLTN